MLRSRTSLLTVALGCALVVCAAADDLSKADAARFHTKLEQIQRNATLRPPKNGAPRTTSMTDREVNSYLRYLAGSQIPVGIADPVLHAVGNGRVTGEAMVDLDAVRTQKKRAWTDPLGYLTGRLPVTAAGTLTTEKGVGRFTLESAAISGVSVPKSLLQDLLSYYSKSADRPAGINMDDPFQLPSAIRDIRIGQGTAVVIQ